MDTTDTSAEGTTRDSQAGFTLIELLVYMTLLLLVFTMVGTMLITSLNAERDVRSATTASTEAQLAADVIQNGVRNSSGFRVTNPSSGDYMVVARTAGSGSTLQWRCSAWFFSNDGSGSIRSTTSSAIIAAPSASQLADWTLLAEGVTAVNGAPVFTAATPDTLSIIFYATSGDGIPVSVDTTAVSRAGAGSGTPACF